MRIRHSLKSLRSLRYILFYLRNKGFIRRFQLEMFKNIGSGLFQSSHDTSKRFLQKRRTVANRTIKLYANFFTLLNCFLKKAASKFLPTRVSIFPIPA